jgi:hypothetical protein
MLYCCSLIDPLLNFTAFGTILRQLLIPINIDNFPLKVNTIARPTPKIWDYTNFVPIFKYIVKLHWEDSLDMNISRHFHFNIFLQSLPLSSGWSVTLGYYNYITFNFLSLQCMLHPLSITFAEVLDLVQHAVTR